MTINVTYTPAGTHMLDALSAMRQGTLTTDHASSSHGLPVVVAAGGVALGPAEVDSVAVVRLTAGGAERDYTAAEVSMLEAARIAGYPVNL